MKEAGPYSFLPFARKFIKVTTPRETVDPTIFAGDIALTIANEIAQYLLRVTEREDTITSYNAQIMEYHSKCKRIVSDHNAQHDAYHATMSKFDDECQTAVSELSKRIASLKERSHTKITTQRGDEMIRRTKAMDVEDGHWRPLAV